MPVVVAGWGKGLRRRREALAPAEKQADAEGVEGDRNPGREEVLGQAITVDQAAAGETKPASWETGTILGSALLP